MNTVKIPGFKTVSENGKVFTVFPILVTINGRMHSVKKRYSELLYIHKVLKKQQRMPTFPPKVVRNQTTKAVETRRMQLEIYLNEVLLYPENIIRCLFDLLCIPQINGENAALSQSMDSLLGVGINHNAVIEFQHCTVVNLKAENASKLLDNNNNDDSIVSGVFQALYN